ncbi:lipocalin-like domain-containing protein [Telluribacter humicola]|uniref:lipocalin family protein n=1 Tax=Telluribacter humicola TaxID=1720261 RepID=UPI001A96B648|nr:lipocalin family protein [Telluribacter humicola]
MRSKLGAYYIGIFLAAVSGFLLLVSSAASPDQLLAGTWEEVAWEYEKVDKSRGADTLSSKVISEDVKQMIAQDLIVHRAEKWHFWPNGTLSLIAEGDINDAPRKRLNWRLKGRGHILLLHYNDETEESYNIVKLTQDELTLHFYTEMQARGIAKITFKRVR